MPSKTLILCHPHLLPPTIFYRIRSFSNELVLCIRWPKYWSFSFSISPSNEHSGLISFRMDWLDLLAVQDSLKSLRQHHSSKTSILWCSAFFIVQLSHPYMTIGKTIALTRRTFVGKVISLLFNMLSKYSCLENPMDGCSSWGLRESDTTERLHFHLSPSCVGEENGNPLQCSCLESPRDGGVWWAAVYGVAQSRTRLNRLSSSSSKLVKSFLPRSSVLLSRSVVSDSLRPHELQHARPPCPSPSPRVHSNSRSSSR